MDHAASSFASSSSSSMQQFTVGKLDAGMAILLGARASLIEFPSLLLPQDVQAGSVVEISVKRNIQQETRNKREADQLQADILHTFGTQAPLAPQLRLRATTQTSVVLEWSQLHLATAKLISLDIYRNNVRLAPIPNPLNNTSTKLSGLEVGVEYTFHLVLKTSAGTLTSNPIRVTTHTMANTSGISVCFGAVGGGGKGTASSLDDGEEVSALESLTRDLLEKMGAKSSTKLQIDTTHYVCTSPRPRGGQVANGAANTGPEGSVYRKAMALNIPIVRPEWIAACYENKKMMPISAFYLDKEPPNVSSVQTLLQARSQAAAGPGSSSAAASSSTSDPAGTGAETGAGVDSPPTPPKDGLPSSEPQALPSTIPTRSATFTLEEESGSEAATFGEVQEQTTGPEGEAIEVRSVDDEDADADDNAESESRKEVQGQGQGPTEGQEAVTKEKSLDALPTSTETPAIATMTTNTESAKIAPDSAGSMEDVSLASTQGDSSPLKSAGDEEDAEEEVDLS